MARVTKNDVDNALAAITDDAVLAVINQELSEMPIAAPNVDKMAIINKHLAARASAVPVANTFQLPGKLLGLLTELNGQDAYDSTAFALGKLSTNEFLRLPLSYSVMKVAAKDVGSVGASALVNDLMLSKIYYLNKATAPDQASAVKYALVRAMAVQLGWVSGQKEIKYEADPSEADVLALMKLDEVAISDEIKNAKEIAFVLPFLAEIVFRTTGHHYLTAQMNEYVNKYRKLFASCLMPDSSAYLPPAQLFHSVLHWVSPARVKDVLLAKSASNTSNVPDAILLRMNAAPAGTALVTTTYAVLNSMASTGIAKELASSGNFNIQLINGAHDMVSNNPYGFHKSHFAYDCPRVSDKELEALEDAKKEAIKLAPYTQGYIEAMFDDAALGSAKALRKYAQENPLQTKRAKTFFKKLAKGKVETIQELFVNTPTEEE